MTTPPPVSVPQKTSGHAIASLVGSLVGIPPLGIICGHIAMSQIKKSGGQLGGHGMALAGLILGYIGMTVFVLLFAISFLFVGARAWKKGSDRSACMMNIRNVQMAIRAHQNMNDIENGETIDWDFILGPSGYMSEPVCPVHGPYQVSDTYPPLGVTAYTCTGADHDIPASDKKDW